MAVALAFDVYGTLIDTEGVLTKLHTIVGSKAAVFSDLWRSKQLEYAFRRGLMQRYVSFAVCTEQALDYCCMHYNVLLSESQKHALLDAYATLPAFGEVKSCLQSLTEKGIPLYAFSNGTKKAVTTLLANAHLSRYFNDVISVDEVKCFKPAPSVYQHLVEQIALPGTTIYLLSSNTFDILGALSSGLEAIWVKRSPNGVLDPWGLEPTATIGALDYSSLAKILAL